MAEENPNHEYRYFTLEETEIANRVYDVSEGSIKMGPKGFTLYADYLKYMDDINNMEIRPDDVFVSCFRRSGTTLTQQLVWLVVNNHDYEAAEIPLMQRYAFLEFTSFFTKAVQRRIFECAGDNEKSRQFVEFMTTPATKKLATAPSPRFIKTHLPISILPKFIDTAKMVYVMRDPRDVMVSAYHHARLLKIFGARGTFKEFWNAFLNDVSLSTPYFEHVKEAWALRDHPNMLFLYYYDIVKKMPETIRRVAKFFGKEITDSQVERLCDHLSIENFKNNKSVNIENFRELGLLREDEKFIRKGKSGGWRDYFDEEMMVKTDQWIRNNLGDSDLTFPGMPDMD